MADGASWAVLALGLQFQNPANYLRVLPVLPLISTGKIIPFDEAPAVCFH